MSNADPSKPRIDYARNLQRPQGWWWWILVLAIFAIGGAFVGPFLLLLLKGT